MNANELTFGIEIETTMPLGSVAVGGYHRGAQVPFLPEGWRAENDCSIHHQRGRTACEFVSPVLRGAEGIAQVIEAVNQINARGGRVNQSCGLHVHVGWAGSDDDLNCLVTLVANFEKAIYASTGTKRRERNHFTRSIQAHGSASAAVQQSRLNRYHILNLNNLASGRSRTVEFRAFAGTLNIVKIIGYLRLCLGLVERAMLAKKTAPFTAKKPAETSPIHRGGEGQTELTRLFYQLGWTKGRTNYLYGDVKAEGAPTVKAVKKQLMELAKKYDSQP